ncbi:thioesterase family protein [Sediminivirga luteola]|uniref:4-hydroxybenzoyl-CoA thioesterase n=1 Tax=Sediminivirga luteola TaxID=1774748 RepID=A0A8J2XJJ7_9MICO|nr:thioesterase family protein [Sediminivirga luteola]GGA06106.1 4-hydroxybenzoyl-CoA thioesterase [Sediminivirga luteola]
MNIPDEPAPGAEPVAHTLAGAPASSLPDYRTTVIEEWIDYNGHLSEAFYVLVFGYTTDQVMEALGLDRAYRERTGASLYTVEAHIRYLREVPLGAALTVSAHVAAAGAKKLHLAYEMRTGGELVATEEILALHVGGDPAAAIPFPPEIAARIDAHAPGTGWEPPSWIGRSIG